MKWFPVSVVVFLIARGGLCTAFDGADEAWAWGDPDPSLPQGGGAHLIVARDGTAMVTEYRHMRLTDAVRSVDLLQMPAGIDPTTLTVRGLRTDVRLVAYRWGRMDRRPGRQEPSGALSPDGSLHWAWKPKPITHAPPDSTRSLRCLMRAEYDGVHEVVLAYRTRGMGWTGLYDVAVEGVSGRVASVDVDGVLLLRNDTARPFRDASVQVLGPARRQVEPWAARGSGFLMLSDDSPLSDRWRAHVPDQERAVEYAVPGVHTVLPGASNAIALVHARDLDGSLAWILTSEQCPFSATSLRRSLRCVLAIVDREGRLPSRGLPAGTADIRSGTALRLPSTRGDVPAFGRGARMEVALGADQDVRGVRSLSLEDRREANAVTKRVDIVVENAKPFPVAVVVDEKPPIVPDGRVLSSSHAYRTVDGRIRFEVTIGAESTLHLHYRIRLQYPHS